MRLSSAWSLVDAAGACPAHLVQCSHERGQLLFKRTPRSPGVSPIQALPHDLHQRVLAVCPSLHAGRRAAGGPGRGGVGRGRRGGSTERVSRAHSAMHACCSVLPRASSRKHNYPAAPPLSPAAPSSLGCEWAGAPPHARGAASRRHAPAAGAALVAAAGVRDAAARSAAALGAAAASAAHDTEAEGCVKQRARQQRRRRRRPPGSQPKPHAAVLIPISPYIVPHAKGGRAAEMVQQGERRHHALQAPWRRIEYRTIIPRQQACRQLEQCAGPSPRHCCAAA